MTDPPVFLVGCPRSGTTLLRNLIDAHPHLSCGPETQFLQDFLRMEDEHWDRLERFGITRDEWRHSVADFFATLHRDYATGRGKRRWVDKSPNYALILDYVESLFPTAQVVHIIRDGRDVVASYRARWGNGAARQAVRAWPRHVQAAQRFGADRSPGRYHEIRYERLVSDPASTMREVFRFLGEPWDDAVLRFSDQARPGVVAPATGSPSAIYQTSVGSGRRSTEVVQRTRLQLRAGALLRELGYQ